MDTLEKGSGGFCAAPSGLSEAQLEWAVRMATFCLRRSRLSAPQLRLFSAPFIALVVATFAAFLNAQAAGADTNLISFTVRLGKQYFNTTNATGKFRVLSGVPTQEAVLVKGSPDAGSTYFSKDDFNSAIWMPYDGIVRMNLGPTDGVYEVELGLKGEGASSKQIWMGTLVTLIRKAPEVFITNPTNNIVTQPYLQLRGYSKTEFGSIKYDISNALEFITNQDGQTDGDDLDITTGKYTAYHFQCYDILLTNGLNAITLNVADRAGNVVTTNLNVTLNYSVATPPAIQVIWPENGMDLCGDSFTLRGQIEDSSSIVTASVMDTNGNSTTIDGLVERTGMFWVKNIPLHDGTNRLALTVKNSAGLSSVTNISVVHSSFILKIDAIKGDLWLPTVTVTGSESDATYPVWVNGVKAVVRVNSDGTGNWVAQNVPVTKGGVASFDVHSYAPNEIQPDGRYGNGTLATGKSHAGSATDTNDSASIKTSATAGRPLITTPIQPILMNIAESNSTLYFTWNTVSNQTYQLQYTTDLAVTNWSSLGKPITATSNSASTSDTIGPDAHRYYRVYLLP